MFAAHPLFTGEPAIDVMDLDLKWVALIIRVVQPFNVPQDGDNPCQQVSINPKR